MSTFIRILLLLFNYYSQVRYFAFEAVTYHPSALKLRKKNISIKIEHPVMTSTSKNCESFTIDHAQRVYDFTYHFEVRRQSFFWKGGHKFLERT